MAVWANGQHGNLILNDDGTLWERSTRKGNYQRVRVAASGTDALMYAADKGYELVGHSPPLEFKPRKETRVRTATKGREYYDFVTEKIESEGLTAKDAIAQAAEHFESNPPNIAAAYYRIRRQERGTETTARKPRLQGVNGAPTRLSVPDGLENILPMIRAGIAAFESVLEWATVKEAELKEREDNISGKEDEARKRIQAELDKLFA